MMKPCRVDFAWLTESQQHVWYEYQWFWISQHQQGSVRVLKPVSYTICLPVMTDYFWPVGCKLSMWWFESVCGSHAGHQGVWVLPTKCNCRSVILKLHCTVAILRSPFSLTSFQFIDKIPLVQWTCLFEVTELWNASYKSLNCERFLSEMPSRRVERNLQVFWWCSSSSMMPVLLI